MKGRPVLGTFAGFFFGLFLALTLQQFGVWPLDTLAVIGLPLLGVAIGLLFARFAPFSRSE
ncbi:MAG: hypothetical protein R3246_00900 [Acidimicrobiia bacterium]|nr:hypothetical protein [Acidimicrobiia bacterium]